MIGADKELLTDIVANITSAGKVRLKLFERVGQFYMDESVLLEEAWNESEDLSCLQDLIRGLRMLHDRLFQPLVVFHAFLVPVNSPRPFPLHAADLHAEFERTLQRILQVHSPSNSLLVSLLLQSLRSSLHTLQLVTESIRQSLLEKGYRWSLSEILSKCEWFRYMANRVLGSDAWTDLDLRVATELIDQMEVYLSIDSVVPLAAAYCMRRVLSCIEEYTAMVQRNKDFVAAVLTKERQKWEHVLESQVLKPEKALFVQETVFLLDAPEALYRTDWRNRIIVWALMGEEDDLIN